MLRQHPHITPNIIATMTAGTWHSELGGQQKKLAISITIETMNISVAAAKFRLDTNSSKKLSLKSNDALPKKIEAFFEIRT